MNRTRREIERRHALASGVAACLLMGKTLQGAADAMGVSVNLVHRVTLRLRAHYGAAKLGELRAALWRDVACAAEGAA